MDLCLYTELGMQVWIKRRNNLVRPKVPSALPTLPSKRCSLNFVHDQFADDRRIRILKIVDDYSGVFVGRLVDVSISGARVALYLSLLKDCR